MAVRRPPPQTERELVVRAEALAGRTLGEVAAALSMPLPLEPRRAKGWVGTLLEPALGAVATARDGPDVAALAIELKSVPVRAGRPAESTFVCSIRMATADDETWPTSRLHRRLGRVLFVPVDAASVAPLPVRRVGAAVLWAPSPEQEALLRGDWDDLMGAIGSGRAGTLTAREGRVLQVRPKAATARVRTLASGADGPERTLPLGFYLRATFTGGILAAARRP
jgi:DNA mismatch repair protein MutH